MTYPHFLGIGVPKAGTTWLYENLRQHPQIWLPPIKEIHYFDRSRRPYLLDSIARNSQQRYLLRRWLKPALSNLAKHPRNLGWHMRFFAGVRTEHWYESLFRPDEGQLTGDITPTYSVLPEYKVAQVAELLPNVKLILILRDPIERIWSHAAMYFSRYGQRGLQAATQTEIAAFIKRPDVLKRSDYVAILDCWHRYFSPEQMYVGVYDKLNASPASFMQDICRFLEIEPIVPTSVMDRVHGRSYPPLPVWAIAQLMPQCRQSIEVLQDGFQ